MPRRKGGPLVVVRDYADVKDVLVPYRRVSTREQALKGAGLAAQVTMIKAGLTFREQTALTWDCVDEGKSGSTLKRPGFIKAMELIQSGQASGIIVSKLDRLSRNLLDFAFLMAKAQKEGWNIVALDLGIDLATPAGTAMAGMLAVFAQFERDVIRQRTLDGLAEKKAEGVRLGRRRSIDDDLLVAILSMYLVEQNFSAVARWLNEAGTPTPQGGKQWYPATIQHIVQSQDARAWMEQLEAVA